ncbi:MAG TPA: tRNA (guanosine(37)-N1)-methyltransferase TrmD [Candidatus Dormibacteraeota bacterium]
MRFDVISIFPGLFDPILSVGVVGRARQRGALEVHAHDLRAFTNDPHRQVDDVPFGGGPGMVLKPEPIFAAVDSIRAANPGPVILFEPWGEPFTQTVAAELAREPSLILVCGRYEGIDDRVRSALADRELSIGDVVLSGGEIPALVVIDAVARLLPGVVGDPESLERDSFREGLLGYPQFTRPAEFNGLQVPEVLLSGNHAAIEAWRRTQSEQRTQARNETIRRGVRS